VRRALLLVATLLPLAVAAVALADGRCGSRTCRADVSVSGHAEPQPIRRAETSEIKLTAQNNGEDGALAIDLQATVPDGLRILSVNHFGGRSCRHEGTFVQCDLGDFASQQQAVVRIKVRGDREGTYITRAKVYASDVDDPNGGNNQVSATLLVNGTNGTPAGGARIRAADPQRITRTGGVRLSVVPDATGTMTVRGEVRTPGGVVRLKTVQRGVQAGATEGVFLGTSSTALRRIRNALRGGRRLRTIVRVTQAGRVSRRELYVRGG